MTSIIFFISSALGCALETAGLVAGALTAAAGLVAATGLAADLLNEGLAGEVAAGGVVCAKDIDTAAQNAVSAKDIRLFIRRTFLTATRAVKL